MAGYIFMAAIFLLRTMWPSTIPPTVSVIGFEFKSSPSTKTVYKPVIVPASEVPALSNKRGIGQKLKAYILWVAGGSPIQVPLHVRLMSNLS